MSINPTRTKLLSFTLGASIAGVADDHYAHQELFIDANQFDFMRPAAASLYFILGGVGNWDRTQLHRDRGRNLRENERVREAYLGDFAT